MKSILLFLSLVGAAQASTVIQLPLPPSLATVGQSGTKNCIGESFNPDGSVNGFCRTRVSSPCSGRGCQPVSLITTYAVRWDAEANPVSEVTCGITRHHIPQSDTTTYAPGFDLATCPSSNPFSPITVVINGTPYYYVTTDAASGAMLVGSNYPWGFLYLP